MSDDPRVRREAALELLDRSLAYTRGALLPVRDEHLGRRTPCALWDLDGLLAHLDDALDAFTEGAAGRVRLDALGPAATRIGTLQVKACALLGAWSDPGAARSTLVGDTAIDTTYVTFAAALEIAVHGWDVAQATGARTPIPDDLARRLLPVAIRLVGVVARGPLFAAPAPPPSDATAAESLLAFLGRRAPDQEPGPTQRQVVSA